MSGDEGLAETLLFGSVSCEPETGSPTYPPTSYTRLSSARVVNSSSSTPFQVVVACLAVNLAGLIVLATAGAGDDVVVVVVVVLL